MASSAKIAFILLLAFSVQINAREFFSKFSSVNNDAKATTTVANTEQQQETSLPNKQDEQYVTKEEQEPTFLPQTQNQNGYGLYGHESGQFPSETTAATTTNKVTYAPYVTPIKSDTFENYNPNTNSDNTYENRAQTQQNVAGARFSQNNNNNNNGYRTTSTNDNSYYNGNGYERQGMSDTRTNQNFGDARFSDNTNTNTNNNGYRTTVAKNNNRYYNGNQNNAERQGMSDTRFMENGKYYYDVENENNYYQNQKASRVPLRNEYTYNNKGAGYYGTNIANSENQMSGQRYENNQDDFEEEFEP